MFEEHYKDGSFAGEKSRNFRLIGVRFGILLAIGVISLIVVGYMKWSAASLHDRLMKRHQAATAYYDKSFYRNSNGVYSVGYTFSVNGKTYHNYNYFKTVPKSPEGTVYYNPDDPEENELQPFEQDRAARFPEIDRAAWFDHATERNTNSTQAALITELMTRI